MFEVSIFGGRRDPDASSWANAVRANGGSVSSAQLKNVSTFVAALKSASTWSLMDDAWLLVAENSTQALTSLKQHRLATIGGGSPTFTAGLGYAVNGSTDFIDTGFIAGTHGVAMSATNVRSGVYERTNTNAAGYAIGTNSGTNRIIRLQPRSTTTAFLSANNAGGTFTLPASDSRGYTTAQRNGSDATTALAYKNGVAMTRTADPSAYGASLPSHSLYLGALNSAGTAVSFRACTIGFAMVGASLGSPPDTAELAEYNALQAYMTALGANV